MFDQLEGEVCEIASSDKVGVHFYNQKINERSSDRVAMYFPPSWLERVKMCVAKELRDLAAKTASLFYDAVRKGDLQTVRFLIRHHGFDVNSLYFNDMTALHLAIKEGQKEIVKFIIDQPQTDLEKQDNHSHYRAIHYAVLRYLYQACMRTFD